MVELRTAGGAAIVTIPVERDLVATRALPVRCHPLERLYEVTVEYPEVLVEPWVMNRRIFKLSNNSTLFTERWACMDVEFDEISTPWRQ